LTDLANSAECRERATHYLRGAHTMRVVSGFGFEQLGLRQEDSQLVIQAMKQRLKVDVRVRIGRA
jgi:hypothetical protein